MKKFADHLSPILLSVFEESIPTGPMRMGKYVSSPIPIQDKNPREGSYCGSIYLLNVNEILSKMLPSRLGVVLPSILADDWLHQRALIIL